MKMIMKLLLILSSFTSIITADERCYNQTVCNSNSNGAYCTNYCPDGCISMNSANTYCINVTSGDPTYSIDFGIGYPSSISPPIYKGPFNYSSLVKFLNSSEFILMKTDYKNNIYGEGVSCPYGCFENNRECIPLSTDYICYPEQQLQCPDPDNCMYNIATNSCYTNKSFSVCGTNQKYRQCPNFCTYDYNTDTCYSQSPSIICDLGYKTVCPYNCALNYYDKCLPNDSGQPAICHHIPIPQCSDGCYYNFTNNQCMSTRGYTFCEAYVKINCNNDYGYDYNIYDINSCQNNMKNNINDICGASYYYVSNSFYLQFPLSMIEKYKNIKCKYSDMYCSNDGCIKSKCPTYVKQCYTN
jgi:hypothetical protein